MKIRILSAAALCVIMLIPGSGSARYFFITSKDGVTLHEEPSITSETVITIPYNTPVEIIGMSDRKETLGGKETRWVNISHNDKSGWTLFCFLSSEYDSVPVRRQVNIIKELFSDAQSGNSHLNRNIKLNMREKDIVKILGDKKRTGADEWGVIYIYDELHIFFADSDHGVSPDTRVSMFAFPISEGSISPDHIRMVLGKQDKSFFDWAREVHQIYYKAGDYAIAFEYSPEDLKIKRCLIIPAFE